MQNGSFLLDALYPPNVACALCNEEAAVGDDFLCDGCRAALVYCKQDLAAPDGLDGLTAGLMYTDAVEPAVHAFKYHRQVWRAPFLAGFINLPPDWRIDCVVPVPLHPLRQWQRTFNQSELLARSLVSRYPLPIRKDLLRRTRYTASQATLDAARRATNLIGAFRASPQARGQSILLIDDVTTTHNTLQCCSDALRQAGTGRVYAACVCLAGGKKQREADA